MIERDPESVKRWDDALLAARLFSLDPQGLGGLIVKAHAGPVRQRYLTFLKEALADRPLRVMPGAITDDRLIGGLDLAQTLSKGAPVFRPGLLAEADQGVVIAAMAERMSLDAASRLSAALDCGEIHVEREGISALCKARVGVISLDESERDQDEECVPPSIVDRSAFAIDLEGLSIHVATLEQSGAMADREDVLIRAASIEVTDKLLEALSVLALRFGILSLRAVSQALHAARLHAALCDSDEITKDDIGVAIRLVFLPRATMLPQDLSEPEDAREETSPPPDPDNESERDESGKREVRALEDQVLEAVKSGLSAGLLEELQTRVERAKGAAHAGKQGAGRISYQRGRPLSSRRGDLRSDRILDVIGTLRMAAPWQRLRRREKGLDLDQATLEVRAEDFQIKRFKERSETTTIFAVDASGSTALSRLAEAKGAVELLLAESYARRDHVALVSFRGEAADLLLAPTRSLVRAKRALAALPGGGGTPLASALQASLHLAEGSDRQGRTPTFVLLTDGSANIALDGSHGRSQAFGDALQMAESFRARGLRSLVVDISRRQNARAREIATAMNGHYVPLPHINAEALSDAVRAVQ